MSAQPEEPVAVENPRPSEHTLAETRDDIEQDKAERDVEGGKKTPRTKVDLTKGAEHQFSQAKKYTLLSVFCVASFLDIAQSSAVFLLTTNMVQDLHMRPLSASWLINSYLITFAAFLPFWGRVSDLYSAKPVFLTGFVGMSIFSLIISFISNQYAYYILRALGGMFASATIPSALRLIPAVFEPKELPLAFSIFAYASALGTTSGVIIAGFLSFITTHNQNAAWRWWFRFAALILVPFGVIAFPLTPHTSGARAGEVQSNREKIKRFDMIGVFLLFSAILMLTLGLTLGATFGFKTAKFLVPFLLGWPLIIGFFLWEDRLPPGFGIVPASLWSTPNIPLLMFISLGVFIQFRFVLEGFMQYVQEVNHEKPIIGAVRYLPIALTSLLFAMTVPFFIKYVSARWIIFGGYTLSAVGYVLFVFSRGHLGADYFRYDFTGFVLNGIGTMGYQALNISIMTSVPRQQAGVVGALWQTAGQIGSVVALAVQSGLFTVQPGGIRNFANLQASYWFCAGWLLVMALSALIFFKDKPKAAADPATAPAASTAPDSTSSASQLKQKPQRDE